MIQVFNNTNIFTKFVNIFFIVVNLFLDDAQFQQLLVWLEDHKIRLYKIENRRNLKDLKVNEMIVLNLNSEQQNTISF